MSKLIFEKEFSGQDQLYLTINEFYAGDKAGIALQLTQGHYDDYTKKYFSHYISLTKFDIIDILPTLQKFIEENKK